MGLLILKKTFKSLLVSKMRRKNAIASSESIALLPKSFQKAFDNKVLIPH